MHETLQSFCILFCAVVRRMFRQITDDHVRSFPIWVCHVYYDNLRLHFHNILELNWWI